MQVKHLPVKDLHALADPRLQPLFVAELLKSLGIKAKAIPAASLEAAKAIQAAAAAAASLAPQQRGSRSGGAAGGADVSALSDMDRLVKSQPSLPLKSRKNKSSK